MPRASQRKGRRAEIELCKILKRHGVETVRPGKPLNFGKEPDVVGLPGIHVEVKRREHVELSTALRQAKEDATYFGGLPAVFHRGNREKWRVTMDLEDWIALYMQRAD